MGALLLLSLTILITRAHSNPWIFQEIKPLTEADAVKKSTIPDAPVKDADPATPTIHIKQDIRDDILGKNKSSTKFKEGVKKLLDFLEAGPEAVGDAPDKETTSPSVLNSHEDAAKNNSKNDNQLLKQNNQSLSYKQEKQSGSSQMNGVNSKDLNSFATGGNLDNHEKEANSNFVNQQREPPAIPMRSEINGNGVVPIQAPESLDKHLNSVAAGDHLSSFNKDSHDDKPLKESNFVTQQKEPPAIAMRSKINGNGMLPIHATMSLLRDGIADKDPSVLVTAPRMGSNLVAKSQIPYTTTPYQSTQLLQNNAIVRSRNPTPANLQHLKYNPYSALYQRSSFPHYYGNYGLTHPNTMATPAYRYPYNQRRMLPLKANSFNTALRSNARLPFYRTATPAYNPQLQLHYAKTFVPRRRLAMIPQRASMSSFLSRRSNIPTFRNFQISHPYHVNPVLPKWNLLGRNTIFQPASRPRGLKYRRLAVSDRGHSYNGLSSPRDKVTQKTPLPLPLASIMTAARIVVPAQPHTLNGAFKSNVETLPSGDPGEEKVARAV
ncbi:uncharacterized protein LOC116308688 isoform X2 [Actinia tenebrosa]|nr:uncharacterized protein LOC116308688 isoform X2 [Actinia tenebrosa]